MRQNTLLIIVPTLNSYQLLPNLVNSLKKQTSNLWRLILIDGESSSQHKQYLKVLSENNSNIFFVNQTSIQTGIYGAMNIGLKLRKPNEWLMFWGSDDLAYNSSMIENIVNIINSKESKDLDLIFNNAIYINKNGEAQRSSSFKIINNNLKLSFLLGFSPPHQACLFSPKILKKRNSYSLDYFLAADLDYFLSVTKLQKIRVRHFNKKFVKISKGGVSGYMVRKRLIEVISIYKRYFGIFFLIPFFLRYIIKINQYLFRQTWE